MQDRDLMDHRSPPSGEEERLIAELSTQADIPMKREALALCHRILLRKKVSPDAFKEVVRVIGMFKCQARWARWLEAAYARQSPRVRRALQGTMLTFCAYLEDWENALKYASVRKDLLPHEIAFSIEAFARAGRIPEVRLLGKRIDRWIDEIVRNRDYRHSKYELGFLYYGFGIFQVHGHEPEKPWLREDGRREAANSWSAVCLDHPLGAASAHNASDLLLCVALEYVNGLIRWIEKMNNWKFDSTAHSLPGDQGKGRAETLARCNRYRRILERLVPEKRRKELGMAKPLYVDSSSA
jgi:hypothetical protein